MSAPQSICTSPTTGKHATRGSRLADTGGVRLSIHTAGRRASATSGSSSWKSTCPARGPAHPTGRKTYRTPSRSPERLPRYEPQ